MIRLGLVVLMIAMPLAAVWSRRLPFTLVPVGTGIIFAGALLAPDRRLFKPLQNAAGTALGAAIIVLVAWTGLSLLWTPFPAPAGERLFKTVATLALAALAITALPARTRTSNLYLLPIGLAAAALALIAVAMWEPGPGGGGPDADDDLMERASLGAVALLWPALGALAVRDRWLSALLLALVSTAAAVSAGSWVALLGLGVGAGIFALAFVRARLVAIVLAAAFGLAFLTAPAFVLLIDRLGDALPLSAPTAKAISAWAATVQGEGLRTLTGHGFDSAVRGTVTGYVPAAAPRGAVFVTWFDLGLVGALAATVIAVRAFLTAGALPHPTSAFMLAGMASVLSIAVGGAVALQLWWMTTLCVVAVGFTLAVRGQYRSARPAAREASIVTSSPT